MKTIPLKEKIEKFYDISPVERSGRFGSYFDHFKLNREYQSKSGLYPEDIIKEVKKYNDNEDDVPFDSNKLEYKLVRESCEKYRKEQSKFNLKYGLGMVPLMLGAAVIGEALLTNHPIYAATTGILTVAAVLQYEINARKALENMIESNKEWNELMRLRSFASNVDYCRNEAKQAKETLKELDKFLL